MAFALAGRIDIDFETEPIGFSHVTGEDVFLRDVWPSRKELQDLEINCVIPEMFNMVYEKIEVGFLFVLFYVMSLTRLDAKSTVKVNLIAIVLC